MHFRRTSIRRLSKRLREELREHTAGWSSAFSTYLDENTSHVGVVLVYADNRELMAWGCLDYRSAYSPEEGEGAGLMGWYVLPDYRRQGLMHVIAEKLLAKRHKVAVEGDRSAIHKVMHRAGYVMSERVGWAERWKRI